MIRAWHPQGNLTHHAMHANLDVLQGIVQGVPQMQCTGHIRRWDDDREGFLARIDIRIKTAGLVPFKIDSIRCPYKVKAIGDLDRLRRIAH